MKKCFFILSLLIGITVEAQTPQRVADIQPGGRGSYPANFTAFNGKFYFIVSDSLHGTELWSYDGVTPPAMVFDFCPGIASGLPRYPSVHSNSVILDQPSSLVVFNNRLYFSGNDGSKGYELYSYDGINMPVLAADIQSGSSSSYPRYFSATGSRLYFTANDSVAGSEFYSYNGLNPPVRLDLCPYSSIPADFTAYHGKVYFSAEDSVHGRELWAYDTLTASASVVRDIDTLIYYQNFQSDYPYPKSSSPAWFTLLNDTLYFSANVSYDTTGGSSTDGTFGNSVRRLCSYDGVTLKSYLADSFYNQGNWHFGLSVGECAAYNNKVYMAATADGNYYKLYSYSPATGIATPVANCMPYPLSSPQSSMTTARPSYAVFSTAFGFTVFHNKLYFRAQPSTNLQNTTQGYELWAVDSTGAATMVADINPRPNASSYPSNFFVWNNNLYFQAADSGFNFELYRFDDIGTKIQNISFSGEVTLYPNPAKNAAMIDITLKAAQDLSITVQDASGKMVYKSDARHLSAGKNSIQLPVSGLAAGNYICTLRNISGGLLYSGKLLKE